MANISSEAGASPLSLHRSSALPQGQNAPVWTAQSGQKESSSQSPGQRELSSDPAGSKMDVQSQNKSLESAGKPQRRRCTGPDGLAQSRRCGRWPHRWIWRGRVYLPHWL